MRSSWWTSDVVYHSIKRSSHLFKIAELEIFFKQILITDSAILTSESFFSEMADKWCSLLEDCIISPPPRPTDQIFKSCWVNFTYEFFFFDWKYIRFYVGPRIIALWIIAFLHVSFCVPHCLYKTVRSKFWKSISFAFLNSNFLNFSF